MTDSRAYETCHFYDCTKPATRRLHFKNDVIPIAYCEVHADIVRVRASALHSRIGRVIKEDLLS